MAATTPLREALNQGISSGKFVDTKIILYSHRHSSGRVGRPKVLYANSHVLKTVPYFNDLLFGNFAESQSKDFKEAVNEQECAEDYGYLSDSDLEGDEDVKDAPVAVPAKNQDILCEHHDERVEKGKIVKIPDMAFVTFQAFLFYLYTGGIEFAPFGSKENRGLRAAEMVTLSAEKIPWPSPKSIYRLADKHDVPPLKALAFDRIHRGLGKCDIVEESFSKFASWHDQIRDLYTSQLASVLIGGDSTETTHASFDKKIDNFAEGELEHVAEMLSTLWRIVKKPGGITVPSNSPAAKSGRAVTSPANWAAVKIALIKSIREGVFFDRKYWVRCSHSGNVSRPVYFSSTVMGDKMQRLNALVIRLEGQNALTDYTQAFIDVESDCEADSMGIGDGALDPEKEKEEQARGVLTNGSFSAWKSLFFYHCTDMISFAPLKSQGIDARSDYIRQNQRAAAPPPCSPKSIHVLASLLEIEPLRDIALADIKSKLSSDNVVEEVFSKVTASQGMVMDMQCDLLVSSFDNPKTTTLMEEKIGRVSDGSSPHCAGALKLGFKKAFDAKKQETSGLDAKKQETGVLLRCSNNSCGRSKPPFSNPSILSSVYCAHCFTPWSSCYMLCASCGYEWTGGYTSCQGCERKFA